MRLHAALVATLLLAVLALGCQQAPATPAVQTSVPVAPTRASAPAPATVTSPNPTASAALPSATPSATAVPTARPAVTPPATTAPLATAAPAAVATPVPSRTTLVLLTAAGKEVEVSAELATTNAARARGLMFRERLADGEGMLFVFPGDTTSGFWMENTLVPLSIAWVGVDGAIVGLDDMQARSREIHSPPGAYRYALEVPQAFFTRQGVKVGDRLLYRAGSQLAPISQLPATREAT